MELYRLIYYRATHLFQTVSVLLVSALLTILDAMSSGLPTVLEAPFNNAAHSYRPMRTGGGLEGPINELGLV